jgi:hypothetical protein
MQSPDDLPPTDLFLCFYDEGGIQELDGKAYTADQMRAYRAEGVAQERERVRSDLFELCMIAELYWKEGGDGSHLALNVMDTIRAIRAGHTTS